jgi:hypothetical protein
MATRETRGSLFVNPYKGRGTRHAGWPEGVEDLSYNLRDGRVWSVTEFANERAVFAVPASRYK